MDLTLIWPLFDLKWPWNMVIYFQWSQIWLPCRFRDRNICISHVLLFRSMIWPIFDPYMTLIWPQMTLKHKFLNSAQKMHSIDVHNMDEIHHIKSTSCILTSSSLIAFISRMHDVRTFSLSKMKSLGSNYPD